MRQGYRGVYTSAYTICMIPCYVRAILYSPAQSCTAYLDFILLMHRCLSNSKVWLPVVSHGFQGWAFAGPVGCCLCPFMSSVGTILEFGMLRISQYGLLPALMLCTIHQGCGGQEDTPLPRPCSLSSRVNFDQRYSWLAVSPQSWLCSMPCTFGPD